MESSYTAAWIQIEKVGDYEGADEGNDGSDPYKWLKGGHYLNELSLYILSVEWCDYPELPNESPLLVVLLSNGFVHFFRRRLSALSKHHFAFENKAFAWSMNGMELVCDFQTSTMSKVNTMKASNHSDEEEEDEEQEVNEVSSAIDAISLLKVPEQSTQGGILTTSRQLLITASTTFLEIWEITPKNKDIISIVGTEVLVELTLLKKISLVAYLNDIESIGRDTIVSVLPFLRTYSDDEEGNEEDNVDNLVYVVVATKKRGVLFLRISLSSSAETTVQTSELILLPGRLSTIFLSFQLSPSLSSSSSNMKGDVNMCGMILFNAESMFCFINPFTSNAHYEIPHNHQYDITTALYLNPSLYQTDEASGTVKNIYFMTCSMDGGRRYWQIQYEHLHQQQHREIAIKQLHEINDLTIQSLLSTQTKEDNDDELPEDLDTKFPIIFPHTSQAHGRWNENAWWYFGGSTDSTSSLQLLTYKIDPAIEQTRETQLNLQLMKPRIGFHLSIPISWYLLVLQRSILPSAKTIPDTITSQTTLFVSPYLLHKQLILAFSAIFTYNLSSTGTLIPWSLFLFEAFDTLRPYFRLSSLPPVPEKLYQAIEFASSNRKREKSRTSIDNKSDILSGLGAYYEETEPSAGKGKEEMEVEEVDNEEEGEEEEEDGMSSDSEDDGVGTVSVGKKASKKASTGSKKTKKASSP
jgi:hypothetical protein